MRLILCLILIISFPCVLNSYMVIQSPIEPKKYKVVATVMTEEEGSLLATGKKNDANSRAFVALPARKYLGRHVKIYCVETGIEINNIIVGDVGPWSVRDFYPDTGERPLAEKGISDVYGVAKNKAGIDLSLKLLHDLKLKYPWKGVVIWSFCD